MLDRPRERNHEEHLVDDLLGDDLGRALDLGAQQRPIVEPLDQRPASAAGVGQRALVELRVVSRAQQPRLDGHGQVEARVDLGCATRSASSMTLISRTVEMPSSTSERYSARPLRVTALVSAIRVNALDVCSRPVSATRFTRSFWIVRGDRLRATAATRSSTLAA